MTRHRQIGTPMVHVKLSTPDGISIEIETAAEDYESVLLSSVAVLRRIDKPTGDPPGSGEGPSRAHLLELYENVSTETQAYLRLLARHPDGLSSDQITRELNIDRHKLAGLGVSLTKTANNMGLGDIDIVLREMTRDRDGRSYHHEIPRPILHKLEQVLPEEDEPKRTPRIVRRSPVPQSEPPTPDDVPF